ncbi:MAG: hypothetical protein ABIH34_01120 [Nanoarchaeota archaeon]
MPDFELTITKKVFFIVLGLLIIVTVILIIMPSSCEQKGGTCRSSCSGLEDPFYASCSLESFNKVCCHPKGDCTDDCFTPEAKICEGAGYMSCGDFDDDPCLEWSLPLPCDFGQGCSEGRCVQSNREDPCQYTENCTQGLECKPSGRYGDKERYCCYPFECASVLDPQGRCVLEGMDILEEGEEVICQEGLWVSPG